MYCSRIFNERFLKKIGMKGHLLFLYLFSDYVYNPKEARIRKALREASRDRSMGSTSMPPLRSSVRRQGSWMQNHEEQLMMVKKIFIFTRHTKSKYAKIQITR